MQGESLDLAIFFDDEVDGGVGAGERLECQCDYGCEAVFSADSEPFVDGVHWDLVREGDWLRENQVGDMRFLKARWWWRNEWVRVS